MMTVLSDGARESIGSGIASALRQIGYRPQLLRRQYDFVDFLDDSPIVRNVDLGVFGQEPFDYRSACLAFHFASSGDAASHTAKNLRAFGAPFVFLISEPNTEHWVLRESGITLNETFRTEELIGRLIAKGDAWGPSSILRAKSGFAPPDPEQIELFDPGLLPMLEAEAGRKLDVLVSRILYQAEKAFSKEGLDVDSKVVFNILFRFLSAKLLCDREVKTEHKIDFSAPIETLRAVDNYYRSTGLSSARQLSKAVLATIADEVGRAFSFRNISVDTLTYVYENTFVSPERRQSLGIHSTPSYIADYVLSQLPLEELQRDKLQVLDPTCGHGIFLIAAMRRMRTFMPTDWGGHRRHEFFVKHLTGVDIEGFSIEVARLCLMLADFPESNGWNVRCEDVFKPGTLERYARDSTAIVGNPPFEAFSDRSPQTPKPVELLRRLLPNLQQGAMLGLVLPKAILDSVDYRDVRRELLRDFQIISITSLPDRIFTYSDAETVILNARKGQENISSTVTKFREVRDADRVAFCTRQRVSWEDEVPQGYFSEVMQGRMIVPALRELWEYLGASDRFKAIANVRIGVQYKAGVNVTKTVFSAPREDTRRGLFNVEQDFMQYVAGRASHMSTDKRFRRRNAWDYDWDTPKVIVPAARLSRGPWRFAAVVDRKGLIASRRFYGVWARPQHQLPVEVLAAILNSPVAAAHVYAHSFQSLITKRNYEEIPIPFVSALEAAAPAIKGAVDLYIDAIKSDHAEPLELSRRLLAIDAEILKLYELPAFLERQLLDLFWNEKRRVPFPFSGFIPPEYGSWIPLNVYISNDFQEATAGAIFERLPAIQDEKLLEHLKTVGKEDGSWSS